jgi:molecular chaperone GrpE
VADKTRFSEDIESGEPTIHTSGGMAEPASERGASADGADIAATDMNQMPSSRADDSQPVFGEGRDPALEREVEQLRDQQLRLAAEFDNYRKRMTRERSELTDRAQAGLVGRLLDVLDDLDRIVASDPAATPLPALREGLTAVDRKLWKELQNAGVERVDPVGQPFDPAQHEAVSVAPAPDPSQVGTVAATFQVGYRFKGALVRPARVQVYSDQDHA